MQNITELHILIYLLDIFSIFGILSGVVGLYIDSGYKNWPTAMAKITESYVNEDRIYKKPVIMYEYVVESKKYYSNEPNIGSFGYLSKEKAQNLVDKYKKNSEEEVNYWPLFPSVSILYSGYQKVFLYVLIAISTMILLSSYFILA